VLKEIIKKLASDSSKASKKGHKDQITNKTKTVPTKETYNTGYS
jgi:hypothetical protein